MHLINEIEFIKINSYEIVMINLLNSATDIINSTIYENLINNTYDKIDVDTLNQLIERKYIFQSKEDKILYDQTLIKEIDENEINSAPNFLVIPTYSCNLKCVYCYEQSYNIDRSESILNKKKIIDKQFDAIEKIISMTGNTYSSKDIRITLMGGEPLLKSNYKEIEYIISKIQQNNYSFNVITNGVDLGDFVEILSSSNVDYIQITIDGPKEIHDKRRIHHDGKGSFDKIIENIRKALKAKIYTFIRVNVDNENIDYIETLGKLISQEFNDSEYLNPYIYLLQDGGCSKETKIIDEVNAIKKIYKIENQNNDMRKFKKRMHGSSFIETIITNSRFAPSLRHCAASKNQYILDYKGDIYKCWHGIGNVSHSVGSFIPKLHFNETNLNRWQDRATHKNSKCSICKYRYICATGCPATDKSNTNMDASIESCINYKEVLDILVKSNLANMGIEYDTV